jgi:hypothetical protein
MAAEFPEKVNESTAGTKPMTNERVYLLMSVADGKIGQVTRILRRRSSITLIDELEGPPDLLFSIEAPTREALANLTMWPARSQLKDFMEL